MNRWFSLVVLILLVSGTGVLADDPVKKAKPSLDEEKKAIAGLWYNLGDQETTPIMVQLDEDRITVCQFEVLAVTAAAARYELTEKDGKRYLKNGAAAKETFSIAYQVDSDVLTLNGRIAFLGNTIDLKGAWKRAK